MHRSFTLLTLSIALSAAEHLDHVHEFRLDGGVMPQSNEPKTSASDSGGSVAVNESGSELKLGGRGGITLIESLTPIDYTGGFVLGLSYSFMGQSSSAVRRSVPLTVSPGTLRGPIKTQVNTFDLHLGYVLPIGQHLEFEALPFVGIGAGTISDESLGGKANTGQQTYVEYGARVAAAYLFDNNSILGVDVGWIQASVAGTIVYDTGAAQGVSVHHDITWSGPIASIFVGIRW